MKNKEKPFIHESSYVDEDVQIGNGTKIWHFCHILSNVKIGENCKIGQNVVIGPDVNIGDNCKIQNNVSLFKGVEIRNNVFIGTSVSFTNVKHPRSAIDKRRVLTPTVIKDNASLGANSTIVCGNNIGEFAFIGAGSVITRDVRPYSMVVGNPARPIGWACECGHRLKSEPAKKIIYCENCGLEYLKE